MLKNLNKGLALFMAIAVMALNLGLINDVLANELDGLEGSDQALARPIKGVSDSTPQPITPLVTQPSNGGGNAPAITTVDPVLTTEYCDSMFANLKMVQSVDHSTGAFDADDLNGDGVVNLTDVVLLAELDLGGQNGTPDGIINLTDVVLFSQKCGNLLTPTPEPILADTITVDHKPWCSALLGVMKGVGNETLRDNKVVDVNGDGYFDLRDVGLGVQLYHNNDDAACQARFQSASTPTVYNFNADNYTHIDWCGGLVQGVKDYFAGSTYNPIFDLNEDSAGVITPDGFINLIDTGLAVQHNTLENNQAHCYLHYGLPSMTPPVTEPVIPTIVPPTPEFNNGGGNHSGNNLLNYIPNPVLAPAPQVLGEKVVECKNKANTTLTQFKEGTLVRGCGPEIYIIKDGKKVHIINLDTLRSKYFGKKILNIGDLINDIKDSSVKVVSAKK